MSLRNFLSLTFLVVLGDVIHVAEAVPAVAAQAGMLETIDIAVLEEAGGQAYSDVAESRPMIKELEPVSGGERKKKKTTQDDLLQLQCETLQLQSETLRLQKETLVMR